jgi:hypothetical protein
MRSTALALTTLVVLAASPALADGVYRGASSVAGGRDAVCAGVTFMTATVSGSDITLSGAVYEGAGDAGSGTVKSDGSFTAIKPTKSGPVTFTGKVTASHVTAQWKGADCYGAIDLAK